MIRKIFLVVIAIISSHQLLNAQVNKLQRLELELSNYQYPYPVSNLALMVQQQELQMAYMDV